mmetsp:Transcript_35600/g.100776  ORF Transcript_35600/g.100776 Transcript_35600/m.100776 type:complete len:220 (+) Transcript_35600:801-1460(+)
MPAKESIQGSPPIFAAVSANNLWPLCIASNLPRATMIRRGLSWPAGSLNGAFQSASRDSHTYDHGRELIGWPFFDACALVMELREALPSAGRAHSSRPKALHAPALPTVGLLLHSAAGLQLSGHRPDPTAAPLDIIAGALQESRQHKTVPRPPPWPSPGVYQAPCQVYLPSTINQRPPGDIDPDQKECIRPGWPGEVEGMTPIITFGEKWQTPWASAST